MLYGNKKWVEFLPHPWNRDPFVVLVLVPDAAKTFVKASRDGEFSFTVMEIGGTERGLQILKPEVPKWSEQAYTFRRAGIKIADPAYVGRLSEVPQKYLVTDEHVVCFLRDEMSNQLVSLRAYFRPTGTLENRKVHWS